MSNAGSGCNEHGLVGDAIIMPRDVREAFELASAEERTGSRPTYLMLPSPSTGGDRVPAGVLMLDPPCVAVHEYRSFPRQPARASRHF